MDRGVISYEQKVLVEAGSLAPIAADCLLKKRPAFAEKAKRPKEALAFGMQMQAGLRKLEADSGNGYP